MTTQPTVTTPTLRDYQEEAVSDFIEWVRAGERMIGLVSPTGSGKTVMLVEFLRRSGVLGLLSSAVIAVPMNSIERAFEQQFERQGEGMVYCPRGKGRSGRDKYDAHLSAPLAAPLAFLTTRQQVTTWGTDALPADLSGKVLVLDEAHHATTGTLDTKVGLLRDAWHARGGIVLLMTATPFRPNGQEVLPAGTRTHVRTLAMHAASGHAPNHFQVQTAMLSKVEAHTVAELQGEALSASENAHGESFRDLVDLWERDGRPKAVFIVPANGSRRWAERLIAALSKSTPRERILDAVGMDKDVADRLNDALDGERNVTTFTDSKYDVIVSCKRFDEGTDWPLCSHVYNYGIPSSLGLILQRFGRATRDKSRISGHTHPDTASITFLVPKVADDLLDAMETKHHRLALTLAILQEDWRLARTMGADLSTRLHDSWTAGQRRAQGQEDQPAKPSTRPERVRDDLRLDAKATLIAWQAKQEQATGRPATLAERHAYLEGLGLEGEKRRAYVAAALDLDVADQPEVMDFVQTEAPGLGYDFEAILRAVGAAFPGAVSDETGNVLKIMSAFTGQDVARVVERIGAEKPDLTEEMIVEAAKRYYAREKRWPHANTGDATNDFMFPETWCSVNHAMTAGGRGLPAGLGIAHLLERHGLKRNHRTAPPLSEQIILAAIEKHFDRTGHYPKQNSGDATEDFECKYPERWANVEAALAQGGRTLPGGDSLAKLMDRHGLKRNKHGQPALDEDTIIRAASEHLRRTGELPTRKSDGAEIDFKRDEEWRKIDNALIKGGRGLSAGSSLATLLAKHGLKSYHRVTYSKDDLVASDVDAAIIEFKTKNGRWPTARDRDASDYFHRPESWSAINGAMVRGCRGMERGGSLPSYIRKRFATANHETPAERKRYSDYGISITTLSLLSRIVDHWRSAGRRPSQDAGDVEWCSGCVLTWKFVNESLRVGRYGLVGGSSLPKFIKDHFTPDGDLLPGIPERYGLTRERLLSLTKDDFNPDGTLKDAGILDLTPSAEPARVPDLTATEKTTGRKTRGKNNPKDDE